MALCILVSYPQSFFFCNGRFELVYDISTKNFEEPYVDDCECSLGSLIGTTSALDLTKSQPRQILRQAMKFTSMAWFLGVR